MFGEVYGSPPPDMADANGTTRLKIARAIWQTLNHRNQITGTSSTRTCYEVLTRLLVAGEPSGTNQGYKSFYLGKY
jgi:hypothetical protein